MQGGSCQITDNRYDDAILPGSQRGLDWMMDNAWRNSYVSCEKEIGLESIQVDGSHK